MCGARRLNGVAPKIEDDRDAIIKVTACAICGSDLHLYDHFMPGMEKDDVMGHGFMGEVVETGKGVNGALKKGERIVVPFTIIRGQCDQCKRGFFSVCERSNRNKDMADKAFGRTTAGLFGYTHLTGGYQGGQAEYVPFADETHIKVPENLSDGQVLFLGDIFPTGWQAAVQADIQPTDTVAIWGAGPVGQMTLRSAPAQTFASGFAVVAAAVRTALTMPWSNAQSEGQITKLKSIKQLMHGPPGFDLLRRRVPSASWAT